jgi:hypothetical protein
MRKRLALILAALGLALAGQAALTTPAHAAGDATWKNGHYIIYQGYDYGIVEPGYNAPAGTTQDMRVVLACDAESDGHGVYVNYWLHRDTDGSNSLLRVSGLGALNGCGKADYSDFNYHITSMQLCEGIPNAADACTAFWHTPRRAG